MLEKVVILSKEEYQYNIQEQKELRKNGCLYLTDDPQTLSLLLEKGFYAAGLVHAGNKGVSFQGNCHILELENGVEDLDYNWLEKVYRRLAGLPWDILETQRLLVRESTVADVDEFYRIYEEPSITRYMENLFPDRDKEIAYMKDYIRHVYAFYGFGMWTVVHKESGRVIGRAGISMRDGYDLPELGYMIAVPFQRQGYATEVCNALLDYAQKELEFDAVQALVEPGNEVSKAMLHKLGFQYEKNVVAGGKEHLFFTKNFERKGIENCAK